MRVCGTAIAVFAAAVLATTAASASGEVRLAGLWDKPNQACMTQCQVFVKSGCFKDLTEKNPGADAASLHDRCENDFSVCLYQCMCENCKNAEKKKDN